MMDWIQVLTVIIATVGSTWGFYQITKDRIDRLEDRFEKLDEKWERLFEKLLLKEQGK